MSDAIARMAIYLAQAAPWKPDRFDRTGPNFHPIPGKYQRPSVERDPGVKARVLTQLQKGAATSETIAKALKRPQHVVSAKLSRLYRDHLIERSLTATSPHTGRKVLVYRLRDVDV